MMLLQGKPFRSWQTENWMKLILPATEGLGGKMLKYDRIINLSCIVELPRGNGSKTVGDNKVFELWRVLAPVYSS